MRRCIMEILFHCLHTTSKHPHISHLSKFCRLQNQLQIFVNEVSIYEYNWFDCMISTHVESIESVDKFHDFLAEVDKYQIDTLLVAETWRDEHEEIFLTVHGHRFSLSGGSLTWSTWCWKWFLSKICLPKKFFYSCLHGAPLLPAFIWRFLPEYTFHQQRIHFLTRVSSARHIQSLDVDKELLLSVSFSFSKFILPRFLAQFSACLRAAFHILL